MKIIPALSLILFAAPLQAHPHIFINTGLSILVDEQNHLTHVKVTWEYDELYSLLVTEDMEVDSDYDGMSTPEDVAKLTGFDAHWIEGYNGDLVGTLGDAALELSGPTAPTAELVDGKIITTHMRSVIGTPQITEPVIFKPYDGTYYTAYDVTLPVTLEGGSGCGVTVDTPDLDAALAMTKAELSQIPPEMDMEAAGLGNIGERFASEIQVTCNAL